MMARYEIELRPPARSRIKRAIDVVGAAVGLLALSPVLAVAAVALRLTQGPGVLFRQARGGIAGSSFDIIKFRTMRPEAFEGEADTERLSTVGRFLRRTSIDELPELVNVLRGEMSLVGPRPLHYRYIDRYTDNQRRRFGTRPGLTGHAQVNGRDALDWDRRFELDLEYLDNWSLLFDLRILVSTLSIVFDRGHQAEVDNTTNVVEFGLDRTEAQQ
jgi:lipopolysaccharide/colanic/teichoic acid biosynthesis glycosyltransferase